MTLDTHPEGTQFVDCNDNDIVVGSKVIDPDTGLPTAVVTRIAEADEGRGPMVHVQYLDCSDAYVTSWVTRETWRCDDVEVAA